MIAPMKRILALVLLCLPALVSAGGRCPSSHGLREQPARALSFKATTPRSDFVRVRKQRSLVAWQRAILFEQQIL